MSNIEVLDKPESKGPSQVLTRGELITTLGITYSTVQAWERQGMPVAHKAGGGAGNSSLYDLEAVKAWAKATGREVGEGVVYAPTRDSDDLLPAQVRERLAKAKLRRELATAEKQETAVSKMKGELVPRDAVIKERLERITIVRAQLLAGPGKLATRLVGRDAREIQQELETWVHEVLTEFARPSQVVDA